MAHFLDRYNKENHRHLKVTPEAMQVLSNCYWPGNVRELQNCIERTATMVHGEAIRDLAFPCKSNRCLTQTLHHMEKEDAVAPVSSTITVNKVQRPDGSSIPVDSRRAPAAAGQGDAFFDDEDDEDTVVRIGPTERLTDASVLPPRQFGAEPPQGERERLIWAMERCGWVQAKAARLLNITPRQMGYALQKHSIEVRKF